MNAPATVEFLYGVQTGRYDANDDWRPAHIVAFRITKKTARRIYYDANLLNLHRPHIRYVPRQQIETDGTVSRKSASWWEPDLQLWLEPPPVWPPEPKPDLAALKAAMAAAHPDRGGTDDAFITARQRYETARRRTT